MWLFFSMNCGYIDIRDLEEQIIGRNGRTDNCLKMTKIIQRWRVKTIAVQHNL